MMTLLGMLAAMRWYLVTFALLAYAAKLYREARKLADFKGPLGTAISKFWILKAILGRRTHLDLYNVNQRYGSS